MKKFVLFLTSILGWSLILYLIIPIISAIGWILWSIFLYKKLFIKEEFKGTIITLIILLILSLVYYIILKIWSKYNYKRYYLKNKRKILPIKEEFERIEFKKLELDEMKIDEIIRFYC